MESSRLSETSLVFYLNDLSLFSFFMTMIFSRLSPSSNSGLMTCYVLFCICFSEYFSYHTDSAAKLQMYYKVHPYNNSNKMSICNYLAWALVI